MKRKCEIYFQLEFHKQSEYVHFLLQSLLSHNQSHNKIETSNRLCKFLNTIVFPALFYKEKIPTEIKSFLGSKKKLIL